MKKVPQGYIKYGLTTETEQSAFDQGCEFVQIWNEYKTTRKECDKLRNVLFMMIDDESHLTHYSTDIDCDVFRKLRYKLRIYNSFSGVFWRQIDIR